MFKERALGTIIRGAALAAIVSVFGVINTGCGGDSDSIAAAILPNITVTANDPIATDNGDTGQFTIDLGGETPIDLTINFTLSGMAENTVDYTYATGHTGPGHFAYNPAASPVSSFLTIPAGSDTETITITPIDDGLGEGTETVTLTITVPDGYAGSATSTTVEIFEDFTLSDLSMTLKSIPAGTFTMGSPDAPGAEPYRDSDEGPQHQVTISQTFWMAETETTVDQFRAFLQDATGYTGPVGMAYENQGTSPENTGTASETYSIIDPKEGVAFGEYSCPINDDATFTLRGNVYGTSGDQPMVAVSHAAANNFCTWLTERETLAHTIPTGYAFRLPTEAEWEYCCRAGSITAFYYGDDTTINGTTYDSLSDYAWYTANAWSIADEHHTHPVADKLKNGFGLYDMHGNVLEWCHDWPTPYTADSSIDPIGIASGIKRIVRGGSWTDRGKDCRSATRFRWFFPSTTNSYLGFRVVLAPTIFIGGGGED
ncbi:hypothetical protein BVY04_01805 [bacterium M21]|nr:hypothetical protein BVY04_01805 [bacterium M21]